MVENIAVIILAYFLGAIPSGYLIGKYTANIDIRKHGSGNVGATNTFRLLGTKRGVTVMVCDIAKGFVATAIAGYFCGYEVAIIASFVAIFAHTFSVFINFKGGKGVATYAGALFYFEPLMIGLCFCVFALTIYFTGYASLASLLSGIVVLIYGIFFIDNFMLQIVVIGAAGYIVFKHRTNIKRLLNGTENKINWGKGNE